MNHRNYVSQNIHNKFYAYLLMGSMLFLLVLIGYVFAGGPGVYFSLAAVLTFGILGPGVPPKLILKLHRARYLSPGEAPEIYHITEHLSQQAGLMEMPAIYYVRSGLLNAFTLGTESSSAIAFTDGMLRRMTYRELSGVIAHEISHIKNKDTNINFFVGSVGRVIAILSIIGQAIVILNLPLVVMGAIEIPWISVMILALAPSINGFLQLAYSRIREYDADLFSARLTSDPKGLASALEKIEYQRHGFVRRLLTAGYSVNNRSILSTHPDTGERVRRLLALVNEENDNRHRAGGVPFKVYQKYII
jgi:heat shock protein HtpX